MGVDLTLFVLTDYGGAGVEFVEASFRLRRDCDLWPHFESLPTRRVQNMQLPHGSWSNYSGETPKGWEDREAGHLQSDLYGGDLQAARAKALASVVESAHEHNAAVLRFIIDHYSQHDVVLFWC